MKKLLIYVLLLTCILFVGCDRFLIGNNVPTAPTEYPNTKWVSQDPNMWFTVERIYCEDGRWGDESGSYTQRNKGQFEHNGDVYEIYVEFNTDSCHIYTFIDDEKVSMVSGSFSCYAGKFFITTYKKRNGMLNSVYDEIIFRRVE